MLSHLGDTGFARRVLASRRVRKCVIAFAGTALAFAGLIGPLGAQDFQIVWVVVGEVASGNDEVPVRAGKHLFMASDLIELSLADVNIINVEVATPVRELAVGERLCLSELQVSALDETRVPIAKAPLSVSVRQDQRRKLGMRRTKRDICLQPRQPGEYPVRLTSMLPAPDGTVRGAQIFLRVRDAASASSNVPMPSDHSVSAQGE